MDIELAPSATWSDLLTELYLRMDETPSLISTVYPVRVITPDSVEQTLSELGIKHGDTLTVMSGKVTVPERVPAIIIREMPNDNSCLFRAVGYTLFDKSRSEADNLRALASQWVLEHAEYTEAMLGKTPLSYSEWLRDTSHWGGGIELSIFAKCFKVEIASVDVATGRMDIFGEDEGYPERVYLLYSGIHYDALALAIGPSAPEKSDKVMFTRDDALVLEMVLQVAELAKLEHRYTDLARFSLQCDICGEGLTGERGAEEHASKTGHFSFSEK